MAKVTGFRCKCGEEHFTVLDHVIVCDSCGKAYQKPKEFGSL